jgi:hypothetical protein
MSMARSVEELRRESEQSRAHLAATVDRLREQISDTADDLRYKVENEWVGELSDSVKEDLNVRAGAVSQSVREASDTLKSEIDDMGTESLERLQETGRNATDAFRGEKAS